MRSPAPPARSALSRLAGALGLCLLLAPPPVLAQGGGGGGSGGSGGAAASADRDQREGQTDSQRERILQQQRAEGVAAPPAVRHEQLQDLNEIAREIAPRVPVPAPRAGTDPLPR